MRTVNHIYTSLSDLSSWIESEKVSSKNNSILVQIYDSSLNKESISEITKTIKKHLPQAIIIGSSSCGVILDGEMHDYCTSITICEFESTSLKPFTDSGSDSYITGKNMAESLVQSDTKCIFIFVDNSHYKADELLNGFNEAGGADVILTGASAGDNLLFKESFVIYDTDIFFNGLVAVALNNSELQCMSYNALGWNGVGNSMIVTKSKGNCIYELNNEPILSMYKRYLGKETTTSIPESMIEFPLVYELDGDQICRVVTAECDDGGLYFASAIKEGTEVKFGIGNEATCINSTADIYVKASFKPVESTFIYSCISRKIFFDKDINEDYKVLASISPQSGFIEYGNIDGENVFLNTSNVILCISESKEIKSTLKTNIINNNNRKKSDIALNNLIQVTTKELKDQVSSNDSLIHILEQYKYALDKSSIISSR